MARDYSTILYDGDFAPAVALITLNRPDKRNSMSPAMIGELAHGFRRAGEDDSVRAVILTGAGAVFCAGGDLSALSGAADSPVAPVSLRELFSVMHDLGKPIVAMVNGHALAGGLGLMVACDVVIASDAATFGTTEIRVGLWPMMITAEITRNVGRKRALELMITGRRIDAAEAVDIGLVSQVAPAAELPAVTLEFASKIAELSPATMTLGLRAFYRTQDMAHDEALEYLEGQLDRVLALDDAREGLMAFLQKRKPVWKGR